MEAFYTRINDLLPELLIPARTEKKINIAIYDRFYTILLEIENELKDEIYIPRKIAGLLFFIYVSLSAEAEHCSYNDELFIAVARLEDMIDRILWNSPFRNLHEV